MLSENGVWKHFGKQHFWDLWEQKMREEVFCKNSAKNHRIEENRDFYIWLARVIMQHR